MVFEWEKVIGPSFLKEESHGAMGCAIPTNLCNLFIQPQKILLTEEHLGLEFDQFCPEGLGWSQYNSGTLQIPQDRILNRGMVYFGTHRLLYHPCNNFVGSMMWKKFFLRMNFILHVEQHPNGYH